jgi:predicted nucleic-acid-binding protein
VAKYVEILPDTNVVLRYLLHDDAVQYERAAEFFESVRVGNEKAIIIESVLVECVYILMKFYKVPKREVADNLTKLLQYKGIANVDRKTLVEALRLFAEQNVDIVDCIVLAKVKRGEGRLFSFDKALNKLHDK